MKLLALPLLLSLTVALSAETTSDLYKSYQQHLQANEKIIALDIIEKAFLFSKETNGSVHATTQILAFNYVQLYVDQRESNRDYQPEVAIQILEDYLNYLEAVNTHAIDTIDPLMTLATVYLWYPIEELLKKNEFRDKARRFGGDRLTRSRTNLTKVAKRYFNKAVQIAELNQTDYPLLTADLSYEIAKHLFARGVELKLASKYLEGAFASYDKLLDKHDARRIMSAFWLAESKQKSGEITSSSNYYRIVIKAYQELELFDHSRLIHANEQLAYNHEILANNQ